MTRSFIYVLLIVIPVIGYAERNTYWDLNCNDSRIVASNGSTIDLNVVRCTNIRGETCFYHRVTKQLTCFKRN